MCCSRKKGFRHLFTFTLKALTYTDVPAWLTHFKHSPSIVSNRKTQRSLIRGRGTSIGDEALISLGSSCKPNIYLSWSTSELSVSLAPWNRFKPSSKVFYWRSKAVLPLWIFYVLSVLCLLCLCVRLFICTLWSTAEKGLTFCLSFVVSNSEFVTFPLVSWVRCGTWLCRFLIFAALLILLKGMFVKKISLSKN